MQLNSTLAPVPASATLGNANPLGRVVPASPPKAGCVPTVKINFQEPLNMLVTPAMVLRSSLTAFLLHGLPVASG